MKRRCHFVCLFAMLFATLFAATFAVAPADAGVPESDTKNVALKADPMDWPHWRGPEMNGISREKNLVDEWNPKGGDDSNLLWKREDLGSRSTPIVMNGMLYTLCRDKPGTPEEGEKVVCVDAATGKTKWENRFNVYLSDVPDTRVGWSSVAGDPATGNVFALGVCDFFQCIDGKTGKTLWSHSLSEEYGMLNTYGGRTNFPIIHGNLVIVSGVIIGWGETAKPTHRFIAFDKRNGVPVWFEGTRTFPYDTTYSAPVLAVLDGTPAIVFGSGDGGFHALQPQTGKSLWTYNVSRRGVNTTPLVVGDKVYAGHSEENLDSTAMGALFALDGTSRGEIKKPLWSRQEWFVGKSSPLYVDGRIYAFEDTGTMLIVNAEDGKLIAEEKLGGPMRSSPIYADGKIYALTENGRWWVFKPSEKGVETVTRARMRAGDSYGSFVVSHAKMYIPTTEALYCIGKKDAKPEADPRPAPPEVPDRASDDKPAHLQLVPVEVLLKPGQKQQFAARVFNSRGQYLRTLEPEKVEFALGGLGAIDKAGKYTTPAADKTPAPVIVSAKAEGLTAEARIRVIPELAWEYGFDDGQVPITFVGARYRHIGLDYDFYAKLKEQDLLASMLYIHLMTVFTNNQSNTAVFDDSNPRRRNWNDLLIYLGRDQGETRPSNIEEAKKAFDPALEILKTAKFIESWEYSTIPQGIKLEIERGERDEVANGAIAKIRTIPLGTKSRGWMGPDELHDYTIQADVLGNGDTPTKKMPDIGLIGQRYTIDLRGAKQELMVRTWAAQERVAKTAPYEWKPNTWYTIKLQVSNVGEKAVAKGKVWERGKEEPADWLVTVEDPSPNKQGSPGLFGNARDAEIFYDNIKVYPNAADKK